MSLPELFVMLVNIPVNVGMTLFMRRKHHFQYCCSIPEAELKIVSNTVYLTIEVPVTTAADDNFFYFVFYLSEKTSIDRRFT